MNLIAADLPHPGGPVTWIEYPVAPGGGMFALTCAIMLELSLPRLPCMLRLRIW
ncbi:hypothetical protein BDV59DRAFT_177741 [Aspergillus ambiguus]|uniref:uncharacterized protein n=1 Tax=Aspergillus ambiguus TaxID=176160 RepID=UPI003CCDE68E